MANLPNSAGLDYSQRADEAEREERALALRERRLAAGRAATFLGAVLLGIVGYADSSLRLVGYGGAAVVGGVFIALCAIDERTARRREELRRRAELNRRAAARRERRWADISLLPVDVPAGAEVAANDLDLFGRASLYQLICRAHTPGGRRLLANWLAEPATAEEIVERQAAVRALSDAWEFREQLELSGLTIAAGKATPEGLISWAEAPDTASRPELRLAASIGLPALTLGALALALHGVAGAAAVAIGSLAVCFLIALANAGAMGELAGRISTRQDETSLYRQLFELVAACPGDAPALAAIRDQVGDRHGPILQLQRLRRIAWTAAQRGRGAAQAILFLFFQIVFLIDLHLARALDAWRREHGPRVRGWFECAARCEALASLAGLAHDQPAWTFPEVLRPSPQGEPLRFSAEALGHPLLRDNRRVANDVELGPPGTVLLVTGSNMSGKSTLLRAIGVNLALAQAGGPVCARRLTTSPLLVGTSMRVHDSLADGVSFFMSELRRLREVVDLALGRGRDRGGRGVLYLLDEILQGTNSAERQIAVARVLKHLLAADAIGAITTHDLALAELPELAPHCRPVYFRETIDPGGGEQGMRFDYQMRQGIAPTTNALKLLALVGLDEERGGAGSEE